MAPKIVVRVHPKIADRVEAYTVRPEEPGWVQLTTVDGFRGPKMPEESIKHFVNDLEGRVELPFSGRHEIDEVIRGRAEFLGKGDDGLAFRVPSTGSVVKVSTTVPYQPHNPGHLTPEEAIERLRGQVELGTSLAERGVPILRSEFVRHGDKGFQLKEFVEIPERWTREQLDTIQEGLHALHDLGYAMNDEVQAGLLGGEVVFFDTGKVAPARGTGFHSDVAIDIDRLRYLYQRHGEHFVNLRGSHAERMWTLAEARVESLSSTSTERQRLFAHHLIEKAAKERATEAKATKSGLDLEVALEDIERDVLRAVAAIERSVSVEENPYIVSADPGFYATAGITPNGPMMDDVTAALLNAPELMQRLGLTRSDVASIHRLEVGRGVHAKAFRLPDGRVLKVTVDTEDAAAARMVMLEGRGVPGLLRVDEVYRFPEKARGDIPYFAMSGWTLYAIVSERVWVGDDLPQVDLETLIAAMDKVADVAEQTTGVIREAHRGGWGRAKPGPRVEDMAADLLRGWRWLRARGFTVGDLHGGNAGLRADGRPVFIDLGTSGYSGGDGSIPIARNPASKVDQVFDETFDRVEELFPDIGVVELHEDEAAGADNGAGAERQFAYCRDGDPVEIAFAPKAEDLPINRLRGLMRHEFGHALEYRYGVAELERRLGKLPESVERRADVIAERVWGEPIQYDTRNVQCVGVPGAKKRRPRHLPDERAILRPNGGR